MKTLLIVGGSDAGISAALRARKVDASWGVRLVVADRFPWHDGRRLEHLDLSYTPPLSSPWDPVQTSCMEWVRAGAAS